MTTTITTNGIAQSVKIKPVIRNKEQLLERILVLKSERKYLEVELKETLNSTIDKFSPHHLFSTAVHNFKEEPNGGLVGKASAGLIDLLLKNILASTKIGLLKKLALQSLAPYASNAVVNLIKNALIKRKINND